MNILLPLAQIYGILCQNEIMTSAILFKYKVHPFTIKINKTIIQLYSIFGSLDTITIISIWT